MAEDSPSGWKKTLDVLNVIGILAAAAGVVVTGLGWWWLWPGWAIGSSITATILGAAMIFARAVSLRADAPIEAIGEWRQGYTPQPQKRRKLPKRSNLVLLKTEYLTVFSDDRDVYWEIKRIQNSSHMYCVALRFGNEPIAGQSGQPIRSLRANIAFRIPGKHDYAPIDRGIWVREPFNQIDLAVGDSRLLIIAMGIPPTIPVAGPRTAFGISSNHYSEANYGDLYIFLSKQTLSIRLMFDLLREMLVTFCLKNRFGCVYILSWNWFTRIKNAQRKRRH
jgi:hypothetical protein